MMQRDGGRQRKRKKRRVILVLVLVAISNPVLVVVLLIVVRIAMPPIIGVTPCFWVVFLGGIGIFCFLHGLEVERERA